MATDATITATANEAAQRYTRVAIWLHWIIGVAVIANIGLAMLSEGAERATRMAAMNIHKPLGIAILALTIVLILWRMGHRPPPPPAGTPAWQRPVSRIVHWLFYALLILLPVSGWLWFSAAGRPIDFFGLFNLPALTGPNEVLADSLHDRHKVMGLAMLVLVVLHVLAALKHQFIDRTGLIGRMNPF